MNVKSTVKSVMITTIVIAIVLPLCIVIGVLLDINWLTIVGVIGCALVTIDTIRTTRLAIKNQLLLYGLDENGDSLISKYFSTIQKD
jgi:hypothetical protein